MKSFPRLRKEISHGGRIPRGWRFAWYEPRRRIGVYYPPPFHWILRAARELAHRIRLAWDSPPIERLQVFETQRVHRERRRLADEYARGYLVGWHECFRDCLAIVEDELTRPNDLLEMSAMVFDGEKLPPSN
jgi:hypothetical protein